LTTDEIDDHEYDFKASKYAYWCAKVQSFLTTRHPHAAELFSLPIDEASQLVCTYQYAADANAWLAAALRALTDESADEGELFMKKLMKAELETPGVSSSGIDVAARIDADVNERDRGAQEREWETLKSTRHLKVGMTDVQVALGIDRVVDAMRVVPPNHRDAPHAVLRAIVDQIPPELTGEKGKYIRAISLAEKFRREPTLESQVLTVGRLAEWIAVDIAAYKREEVSAVETDFQKAARDNVGPCTNCNGPHFFLDCTQPACPNSRCRKRYCQGARGMVCWVAQDAIPDYKDATGAPLHRNLQARVNELRAAAGKPVDGPVHPELSMLECCSIEMIRDNGRESPV
jgi:hypothetical protein